MKTVYSNGEIAHVWVNNGQIEARNSNGSMSFHGDKFYSYRTVIALRVNGTIVLSLRTYSNTTTNHQSAIKSACNYNYVQCHDVNDTPAENFNHVKSVITNYIEKQKRAQKMDYLSMARAALQSFKKYAEVVGYKCPVDTIEEITTLTEKERVQAEKAKRAADRKLKKERTLYSAKYNAKYMTRLYALYRTTFHRGQLKRHDKIARHYFNIIETARRLKTYPALTFAPDLMRVKEGGVITTRGVNITRGEARLLFEALKRGINPVGYKIAHYTIEQWDNAGGVKIGCHTFPRDEFSYISSKLFGEAV